jgi:hypothetical protein
VILTVDGADTLMAVAVDSDDRLYIADRGSSFIHVFDNAASLMTGIQAPDRQFDDLELNAPMRLLILEP